MNSEGDPILSLSPPPRSCAAKGRQASEVVCHLPLEVPKPGLATCPREAEERFQTEAGSHLRAKWNWSGFSSSWKLEGN